VIVRVRRLVDVMQRSGRQARVIFGRGFAVRLIVLGHDILLRDSMPQTYLS